MFALSPSGFSRKEKGCARSLRCFEKCTRPPTSHLIPLASARSHDSPKGCENKIRNRSPPRLGVRRGSNATVVPRTGALALSPIFLFLYCTLHTLLRTQEKYPKLRTPLYEVFEEDYPCDEEQLIFFFFVWDTGGVGRLASAATAKHRKALTRGVNQSRQDMLG